jgi:hypothetical protein
MRFCWCAGLLLWPALTSALGLGIKTELDAYSEPVPVLQMIDGWQQGGVGQYAQGRWVSELYLRDATWQFGWVSRKDYYLRFSRDTARFYHKLENQQLEAGQYPLDLEVNTLESRGFNASHFIPLSFGGLSLGLSVLRPYAMHQGSLSGIGEVSSSGIQSFEYNLDYRYSRHALLEQDADNTNGLAHAFAVHLEIPFAHSKLNLLADDVFYRVYWRQIGRSQGCIYQNRISLSVCEQNFVQDTEDTGVQILPGKYQLNYEQNVTSGYNATLNVTYWGLYRELTPGFSANLWSLGYGLQYHLLTLGLHTPQLTLQVGLDTAAVHTAKQWRLLCDWNMDF